MNSDELYNKILEAKEAYYSGDPILSDSEYDALEKEWRNLNPENKLQVDAGQDSSVFSQPYLSLKKVDLHELKRFVGQEKISVLPKLDGVSMEVHLATYDIFDTHLPYRWFVKKALTRGGTDVTEVFKSLVTPFWENITLDNLNQSTELVVRGEVYYNKEDLEKLKELGFANLRNSVAGLLNRKELGDIPTDLPKMQYAIWKFLNYKTGSHAGYLNHFKKFNFPTADVLMSGYPYNKPGVVSENPLELIEEFENDPKSGTAYQQAFDYEIDGLVIFIDDIEKWPSDEGKDVYQNSVAWKFESPSAETTIREIKWYLGTTGTMTPVALVDPIDLGGVTVRNVNLHNHENMGKLKAYPGYKAVVTRANDVIPTIFTECTPPFMAQTQGSLIPIVCPVCTEDLEIGKNIIRCINKSCDNKITGVVEKWVTNHEWKFFSEEALGDTLSFFKNSNKHPIIRIYDITEQELNNYMTSGLASRLWLHYKEAVKNTKPETLIGSLNIELVGVRNAKEAIGKVDKLINLPIYLKQRIDEGKAYIYEQNLMTWIKENYLVFMEIVSLLDRLNIGIEKKDQKETKGRVVITGEVPNATREEAFAVIEARGYEASNSLSKSTLYLITEFPDSGTTKLQKARKYGVKIITWREFLALP